MSIRFFALGSFSIAGCPPFAGLVLDERVIAVHALQPLCERLGQPLSDDGSVLGLLQQWERNLAALQRAVDTLAEPVATAIISEQHWLPLAAVHVHAPILYPRQIFCAGANYRQHVIELATAQGHGAHDARDEAERRALAERIMDARIANGIPYVFTKIPSAITGPYDPIPLPSDSTQPDWELELGVVIGRPARRVKREEALAYVAGYTIVNDLTCRDRVYRPDLQAIGSDWLRSKCPPGFLPTGPFLVPASFVPDPQQLHLTLKLNDQVMQDEGTDDMIFGVARLIEYISHYVQLWPGDLICTGSPRGNGMHYRRFLQPGDVLEGSISGLGSQRNRCIAEEESSSL
ncbi:fumarylacetoacetate hydrolase family protein [Thermogemmatispora onikobensis]|uniref:fumarylacetoacetate hydrolase family protein n=1 Tax=Thermogemmatispora onikobensis TaxID=732234 RepID=UPI000853DF8B|nr:fumarylacetoacetate hydrolase family protein [Thermogemmatispora onikobensis]